MYITVSKYVSIIRLTSLLEVNHIRLFSFPMLHTIQYFFIKINKEIKFSRIFFHTYIVSYKIHSFVKTFHTFIKSHTLPYYSQNNQNNNLYLHNQKPFKLKNKKKWTFATCFKFTNASAFINASKFYHIKSLIYHTQIR